MYQRFDINDFLSPEIEVGIDNFLNFAYAQINFISNDKICCPYSKCQNRRFLGRDDVTYHLTKMNLLEHILSGLHTMNLLHRNKIQNQFKSCSIDCMNPTNYISNSKSMVIEAIDMNGDTIGVDNYEAGVELEKPNLEVLKFYRCLHDANAPLLEVCRNHISLCP